MPSPIPSAIPQASVLVKQQDLPQRAYRDLLDIRVQEHIDGPSEFTLRLSAWNDEKLDFGWVDDDLFEIGTEVQIALGYQESLEVLILGDIVGIDFELGTGEKPAIVVRGYDRRHRMRRGSRTATFKDMKDSDIAAKIAQEYGLGARVEDSGIVNKHLGQNNQSDLDFLSMRADAIGYELMVLGKMLHFRSRKHAEKPSFRLDAERDLLEFSAQISVSQQVSEVMVRAWDPKDKKEIVGRASSDSRMSMGGKGGPEIAENAFGATVVAIVGHDISTQEQADRLAKEQLEKAALSLVQCSGSCLGRNDLRAGMVVDIQGVGKRFSGAYYLGAVSHSYTPGQGYRTSFSGRRNSI